MNNATIKSFKVDDIVSIDLSPRYQKRLIGVVVDVIEHHPHEDGVKGELMWGIPWEGPYPLVQVFIHSIVGINGSSEDGYYYMTGDHISKGKISISNKKLVTPTSKFKVGDRVAHKAYVAPGQKLYVTTVKSLPTIKTKLALKDDGGPFSHANEDDLILFSDAKKELARLNGVVKKNKEFVEHRLREARIAIEQANEAMVIDGSDLGAFLRARSKTRDKLVKTIIATVGYIDPDYE
jgi:hypothetical protein